MLTASEEIRADWDWQSEQIDLCFYSRCSTVLIVLFFLPSEAAIEQLMKIVVGELRLCVHHLNGALMLDMLMLSLNGSVSEIFQSVKRLSN